MDISQKIHKKIVSLYVVRVGNLTNIQSYELSHTQSVQIITSGINVEGKAKGQHQAW